jgi:hypothetical protein
VPAEELDVSHKPEPDRHDALLCWPGASLVQQVPKPLGNKEPHLSCRAKNTVARLVDINGIELAIAEFAAAGNREDACLRAFRLQPFPALAAAIEAAAALREMPSAPI